eukprot:TRINITY_DN38_c0_g1_i11.p1 TRINITY_DN38_c0_g1~~TRINITY_DN38_c0_g1_i11.p1  ORF type:complete len:252 (-),score=34.10 TRINITY_DN38_c0_g1_i11:183-938(-)
MIRILTRFVRQQLWVRWGVGSRRSFLLPYPQVTVKSDKESSENAPVRDLLRKELSEVLRPIVQKVMDRAKESINIQSPVVVHRVITTDSPVVLKSSSSSLSSSSKQSTIESSNSSTCGTKSLKQIVVFEVPPPPLFESFIDERRVSAYTQGPAKISPQPGGSFEMFGGAVSGQILSIETNSKLVQKWRFNTWPKDHYSEVTMEFLDQGGRTQITLLQTGIPSQDFDRTKSGWEEFFWRRIKGLFGWHYKLK